jgi:hypothetical protein
MRQKTCCTTKQRVCRSARVRCVVVMAALRFKLDEALDQILSKSFYWRLILSKQLGDSFFYVPVIGVDDLIAPEIRIDESGRLLRVVADQS